MTNNERAAAAGPDAAARDSASRLLGLTMGDAAGIGPEIIVRALAAGDMGRCVVLGSVEVMRRAVAQSGLLLPGDGRPLRRIAWCTGGAQGYFEAAIAAGADAFITGEISEPQAHYAREMGVAFLACGHHATERYGAPAVAAHVAAQLGLAHEFIDIDNPA